MRIAIVQPPAPRPSLVERPLRFARELRSLGVDARLFGTVPDMTLPSGLRGPAAAGVPVALFEADVRGMEMPVLRSRQLLDALDAFAPDAVLGQGLGYGNHDELVAHFHGRCPLAVALGGKWWHRSLFVHDAVFVEFAAQIPAICEMLPKPPFFQVMPKAIDWEAVDRVSGPRDTDIACVGRFVPLKNQAALAPLFGAASIVFAGHGPTLPEVTALAGGAAGVTFLGEIPRPQVMQLLSRSRLLVHPSIYEGLPRVAIEAFACGTPLVALRATLGRAFDGLPFVTLVDDAADLKDVVTELLADPRQLVEQGREARRYAEREHGPGLLRGVATRWLEHLRAAQSVSP